MVATLAFVLSCMLLVIAHHGTAALVLLVLAVAGAATLLLTAWRRKRLMRALPKGLDRLAWRSDETAVALAWRFTRGRDRRVRILRSERGFARVPDGGSGRDQVTVFDGEGDQVIDRDVRPRRTYFYTFVVDPPEASHVVRMEIPTLSAEARAAIEATYASRPYTPRGASYIFIPGGPCDPSTIRAACRRGEPGRRMERASSARCWEALSRTPYSRSPTSSSATTARRLGGGHLAGRTPLHKALCGNTQVSEAVPVSTGAG